ESSQLDEILKKEVGTEDEVLSQEDELHLQDEFEKKAQLYTCSECGAEIIADENTSATSCVFCHSPAILPSRLSGVFRPSKIIPFSVDKNKALEMFAGYCKHRPLIPKLFYTEAQREKLSGVYVPFWLYDCDVNGVMNATGHKIRTWISGNYTYTETKIYKIEREGVMSFDDVPADASKKMPDDLMDLLEPYKYSDMKDFSMAYLSGFLAEKYDQTKEEIFPRVKSRLDKYTQSLLRNTIKGYTTVINVNTNIKVKKNVSQYALMPVWMLNYKYKNKQYMFAVNGQTGRVVGNLPYSKLKAFIWFLLSFIIVVAILFLGGMFLW
ncbi:MAG: hypothetical protein LBI03_03335, partial [Clostridiales bacterium]|nr:hypothetical protein [Clostridiales bacterium]